LAKQVLKLRRKRNSFSDLQIAVKEQEKKVSNHRGLPILFMNGCEAFIHTIRIHSFELARGILTPNEMGGEMEGFENIYVLLLS
jgi:hypothetical protein